MDIRIIITAGIHITMEGGQGGAEVIMGDFGAGSAATTDSMDFMAGRPGAGSMVDLPVMEALAAGTGVEDDGNN